MLQNGGELDGARILKPATVRLDGDRRNARGSDRHLLAAEQGQGGIRHRFRRAHSPARECAEASGAVGEFFWDGAADTLFWVDPKNKITAVLFTQYKPFGKVPLHKAFRDAVYAAIPEALAH